MLDECEMFGVAPPPPHKKRFFTRLAEDWYGVSERREKIRRECGEDRLTLRGAMAALEGRGAGDEGFEVLGPGDFTARGHDPRVLERRRGGDDGSSWGGFS